MSLLASYMGLGGHQLQVERLSTASTVVTLTYDQQGKILVWGQNSSASRIVLPSTIEAGMAYHVYMEGDGINSSGTKFIASSDGTRDFYIIDGTTAEVFVAANGSTVEGGIGVSMYCIATTRWIVDRWGASTIGFAVTAGSTTT